MTNKQKGFGMSWLLEEETRRVIQAAYDAGHAPNAEQITEFEAAVRDGDSLLTTVGSSSEIRVEGVLTQKPDFMARFFGGGNTTYPEIISALAEANADPSVKDITLAIDSPGGQFSGMFEAMAAIQASGKPVRSVVHGMAASAAYALASQTNHIEAHSAASMVGSIGVVATMYVSDSRVDIASTNAPKKRPDVKTEAGKAIVREELDALAELFVDAVATGRKVSVQAVNADFGQGATLLAGKALSRGMIDAISGTDKISGGDDKTEATSMDIQTLRAEHPGVYAQVIEAGVAQERDRVSAHLILGAASGAMETAIAAVEDGSEMTQTLNAKYQAAGMNRDAIAARQTDDVDAAAADNAEAPVTADVADEVVALLEAEAGIEVE